MPGRKLTTLFHTSHPGLSAVLRRDPKWRQISAALHGDNKARSARTIGAAKQKQARGREPTTGYGGHFRAVQGFRYYGEVKA